MTAIDPKVSSIKMIESMHVAIKGKIIRSRRFEQNYYTAIIIPARDEYSKPSVVEVRSKTRIGDLEEVVALQCILSGYEGRAYSATDPNSGEQRKLIPVNHVLDLIE